MNSIQYLNKNDRGAQYVDCEILEVKNCSYFIEYYDGAINNKIWVKKSELRFPTFGDMVV